ncbi:MAG: hypothetical protein JWP35_3392 [Caulobacter sp.]|nr:hypothetical protein [Caulobacter sp.]
MTDAERKERAEKLWAAGCELREAGDTEGAIPLFRDAAGLGDVSAQDALGSLLTDASRPEAKPADHAEGLRWYYRAVRAGSHTAAWNLAMTHRMRGNRRGYFRWVRRAVSLGDVDAARFLRVIEAIRSRGHRAPMLYLDDVDEFDVRWVLWDFVEGVKSREEVRAWAVQLLRGQIAIGLLQSRRVAEAVEELADPARRLTKRRARELLAKLA